MVIILNTTSGYNLIKYQPHPGESNMVSHRFTRFLAIIASTLIIYGCASDPKGTDSGYLGDYSMLKTKPNYENTRVYVSPEFDKSAFRSGVIFVEPFEVWATVPQGNRVNSTDIYQHKYLFLVKDA